MSKGKSFMSRVAKSAKKFGSAISANGALTDSFQGKVAQGESMSKVNSMRGELRKKLKEEGGEAFVKNNKREAKKLKSAAKDYKSRYGSDAVKDMKNMGEDAAKKVTDSRKSFDKTKDGTLGEKWKAMSDSGLYESNAHQAADTVRNYFAGPDVNYTGEGYKNGLARVGAVGGAYAGANAIGRAVTGGSMYRNNKGERDIAGIPFV